MKKEVILITLIFISLINVACALNVNIPEPINYSEKNVNNSYYLQGYTPTTLGAWLESTFGWIDNTISNLVNYYTKTQSDDRYVNIDGDNMTGDLKVPNINVTDNIFTKFTKGSVLFIGTDSNITEMNEAFYFEPNGTEGKLAVGSTAQMRNIFQAVKSEAITVYDNVKALMAVRNKNTNDGTYAGLSFQTLDTGNNVYSGARIMTNFTSHNEDAVSGDMLFDTRHEGIRTIKMIINSLGNVGIGTTSPNAKLDINASGSALNIQNLSGSSKFYVNASSGNVGIGTAAPSQLLDVDGRLLVKEFNINGGSTGEFRADGTSVRLVANTDGKDLETASRENIIVSLDWNNDNTENFFVVQHDSLGYTPAKELFRVQEDGNVGIGTTSPNALLEIKKSSTGLHELNVSGVLYVNSTSGNVGIGTAAPSQLLDVDGRLLVKEFNINGGSTGEFRADGTSVRLVANTDGKDLETASRENIIVSLDWNNDNTENFFVVQHDSLGYTPAKELFRVQEDGNVGIGTTSPDTKLQVVGNFKSGDDNTNYISIGNEGEIVLIGNARVKRHIRVSAPSWKLGVTAPTPGYEGIVPTLDFDSSSDDSVHYSLIVPYRLDTTTNMSFSVDWNYDGVSDDGNVTWCLEYIIFNEDEIVDGTTTTICQLSETENKNETLIRTKFTQEMNTDLNPHKIIGLRLYRDVSEGTLSGDIKFIQSHFEFTQNKLGRAL